MAVVGVSTRRLDGPDKLRGATRFTEDMKQHGLLHAKLILSHVASGRIESMNLEAARIAPGVVAVLTSDDLRQVDASGPDQPLAKGRVYYIGQPVVAVLAETAAQATDAAGLVEIDYQELPAVSDPFEAMQAGAPQVMEEREDTADEASIHGGGGNEAAPREKIPNVSGMTKMGRGDVAAALASSDHVIEATYTIPGAHQGFIEPHVCTVRPEDNGGLTIWAPTQGHFFVRDQIAGLLKLPTSKVRVVPMPVGGGFGGKVSLLEPLVSLLALHSRRPVTLALTRSEEFLVGRPAPACSLAIKLGARADGTMTALEARIVFDNGATNGWHGGICASLIGNPYRFEAVGIEVREVCTNKTPVDAYRAPGGTQAYFALESAVDELAGRLGIDPIELRVRNAVRQGDTRLDGSTWPQVAFLECLEEARRHPLYTAARAEGEGVGVAAGLWGGAFEPGVAGCRVEPDGTITLSIGAVDISGSSTSLAMIAAETLGVSIDRIQIEAADTGSAPYGGPAGGSKTIYSYGPAVIDAAAQALKQIYDIAAEELEASVEDLEMVGNEVGVKGVPGRTKSLGDLAAKAMGYGARYKPVQASGRAAITTPSPAFTVHIARVKADRETGAFRLTGYVAIQDVGKAINPAEVIGQIQGGAVQGIGRALGEQMSYDSGGQLRTGSFLDYEMPSVDQMPDVQVTLLEVASPIGPFGAKGVGEPPAVPGPAAVANAVAAATGVRLRDLPLDPSALI